MKAVICTTYGAPEVLQLREAPKPVVKENQLLVKIVSTAVNSGDVRVRGLAVEGFLKIVMRLVLGVSKPRKPILGTVYAGIVERVGSKVSKFSVGDKVFGMTGFDFGTYAEYISIREDGNVLAMPEHATFDEAVSLIFGGQTAIHFLEKARISTRVRPKVLIIGATGAVGTAAIQIAQSYQAEITAICSSSGLSVVNGLGVSDVVLYDKEPSMDQGSKFDIIFDAVGKAKKSDFRHHLHAGGVYVSVSSGYASETVHQLQQLKSLFEKGKLKAVIDRTFPLKAIVEAHRYVDTGRKKGNVVVRVIER